MKLAAPLLALALLASPALAQPLPINISADTFTVDQAQGAATFSGNVVITREGMTLWADRVDVDYGTGGQTDIDGLTATGHVRIKTGNQDATGGKAVFDPDSSVLTLTDNVKVVNAQGTVAGPELTINLRTNQSVFKGSEGGRVTGVFTPQ